jgi:CBS domain-containing protein
MKAADVMTLGAATVRADAPISEAVRLMIQYRISGLPVLDAEGRLKGMVTEGDFLRRSETHTERRRPRWLEFLLGPGRLADEYVHSHGRKVEEIMTANVVTVTESTPLEEVVRLMERHRVKRVPVVSGDKLVGIVSRANLLHALARLSAVAAPPSQTDADIRGRIIAEVQRQPWAPHAGIEIAVRDGVVELWGTLFDERERQALKVACENTAGVTEVRDNIVWVEPMSGMVMEPPMPGGRQP